jgi:hypothetical protein
MRTFTIFISSLILATVPLAASAQFVPPPIAVNVTDTCTATATDGSSEIYSQQGLYLAICALIAAKEQGVITSYSLSYFPGFGFFVDSLNGINADPLSQYWALYKNDIYSEFDGLSTLQIATGNSISLKLTDFSNNLVGPVVEFLIGTTSSNITSSGSSGAGGLTLHDPFSVRKAFDYIRSTQNADGSFGSPLLNDWVAIATAGGHAGDLRRDLTAYVRAHPTALSSITDYERHAMALMALDLNPYTTNGRDVIQPIVDAFDGIQVGDSSIMADDIFAVFPLLNAGHAADSPMIAAIGMSIIAQQEENGSWAGSVDMTAAAIQALSLLDSFPDAPRTIERAFAYLRSQQEEENASFGNSPSTSWVLQAAVSRGQSHFDWTQSGYHTPSYFLATQQELDGGVGPTSADTHTRVWATAQAIPAIEMNTWDELLADFTRPEPEIATTTATSTVAEATATATSTAPLNSPATFSAETSESEPRANAPTVTSATPGEASDETVSTSTQLALTASAATASTDFGGLLLMLFGFALLFFAAGGAAYSRWR